MGFHRKSIIFKSDQLGFHPCDWKDPFVTGNDRLSGQRDCAVIIAHCEAVF